MPSNDCHPWTGIPVTMLQLGYLYLEVHVVSLPTVNSKIENSGVDCHKLAGVVLGGTARYEVVLALAVHGRPYKARASEHARGDSKWRPT